MRTFANLQEFVMIAQVDAVSCLCALILAPVAWPKNSAFLWLLECAFAAGLAAERRLAPNRSRSVRPLVFKLYNTCSFSLAQTQH